MQATKHRINKIKKARRMRTEGVRLQDIADYFGVNRSTIYKWLNRARQKQTPVLTYFVSDNQGHVKIGSARDPEHRLLNLQVGNVHELTLLGTTETNEGDLHVKFAHYHVRGEWFVLSDEIRLWVENNCEMQGP